MDQRLVQKEKDFSLTRQASLFGDINFRDYREFLGQNCQNFTVSEIVHNLDQFSYHMSIDKYVLRNIVTPDGKRPDIRKQAKEQLRSIK